MTRKKVKTPSPSDNHVEHSPSTQDNVVNSSQTLSNKSTPELPTTAPLLICRNKHWRHISSYHGPWLNLPCEVLESLAYSNYYSPRPAPIDPAVFFDLVKIRRLVEDATSLVVRAANGTTSSSLNNSLHSTNGILSNSNAEILGIGSSRGGGHAKLSRERKHRMRDHATQKLAQAYRLDEIATTVLTMQSASALEDVANLVIQRNETDPDAQYVHFFHERIPSRAIAECTTLDILNSVILQRPFEASTWRTRAVVRLFKDDYEGAVKDLTEGLTIYRLHYTQHQNERRDLILVEDASKLAHDSRHDSKIDEKDQPCSLEPQFLFHRASTYLTLACGYIAPALQEQPPRKPEQSPINDGESQRPKLDPQEKEEARARAEARKYVRTYAKRALRDYLGFLSHFEYTPGLSAEYTEAILQNLSTTTNGHGHQTRSERLLDMDSHSQLGLSEALVKYESKPDYKAGRWDEIPKPSVYKVNELFAAVPPPLPLYPPDTSSRPHPSFNLPDYSEAVTYHPLLTDVLHSLLLCHCLVQTSTKELQRHACMAARVARVCEGYPIFLAPRSPARGDWIEIIRRSGNFLNLEMTWESLCAPVRGPHQKQENCQEETAEEKQERIKQRAVEGALGDDRVVDEESFKESVHAREMMLAREEEEFTRQEYDRRSSSASPSPQYQGQPQPKPQNGDRSQASTNQQAPKRCTRGENARKYSLTTERAKTILWWLRDASPPSSSAGGNGKVKKKSGAKARARRVPSHAGSLRHGNNGDVTNLEQSVESLNVLD